MSGTVFAILILIYCAGYYQLFKMSLERPTSSSASNMYKIVWKGITFDIKLDLLRRSDAGEVTHYVFMMSLKHVFIIAVNQKYFGRNEFPFVTLEFMEI